MLPPIPPNRAQILAEARKLGFDAFGIAGPLDFLAQGDKLDEFLRQGFHGDMTWLAERAPWRRDPLALWPEVRSIIMLGLNYGPAGDPLSILGHPDRAGISVYAQGRDYHDVIKGRLKQLGHWLHHRFGARIKVFVDTAPVMEKPLAERAGLGWQGKHTNLVSRTHGSWLFLGAIFTNLALPPDPAEHDHCGNCHRCLDACPTAAFPAPYRLDARRCISYLTIEHRGQIPLEFRALMGNRIYGCDDCLVVCPWNKYAVVASESAFHARTELKAPRIADLLDLSDAGFRKLFSGSPVKRIGRDRFIRNVLVAAGNSGDAELAPQVGAVLADGSALVRGMAVWALARLCPQADFRRLKASHLPREVNAEVRDEWLREL